MGTLPCGIDPRLVSMITKRRRDLTRNHIDRSE